MRPGRSYLLFDPVWFYSVTDVKLHQTEKNISEKVGNLFK